MHSRKKRLQSSKLYLILDRQVASYRKLFDIAVESIFAGVDILQLRDKHGHGREILEFSKSVLKISNGKSLYIVNDRIDIAYLSGADGVHLGQDDVSIKNARKFLDKGQLVGYSCQSLAHIAQAKKDKADYIGFGSVFKTKTKPGRSPMDLKLLKVVAKERSFPVFAIGGIDLENVRQVLEVGVKRVAVCRAICQARDVVKVVKDFNFGFKNARG